MALACLDTKLSSPVQYALTLLSNQHMDETVVKIKAPVYAVRAAGSVFVFIKVPFSLVPSVVFCFFFSFGLQRGEMTGKHVCHLQNIR